MKKFTLCVSLAMSVISMSALAASKAHYGLPQAVKPVAHVMASGPNNVPLVITNYTTSFYDVYTTQGDGTSSGRMTIYPYLTPNYLYMISIDNPAWPVYVEVDYPGSSVPVFDGYVSAMNNHVDINPSALTTHLTSGKTQIPQVTVH